MPPAMAGPISLYLSAVGRHRLLGERCSEIRRDPARFSECGEVPARCRGSRRQSTLPPGDSLAPWLGAPSLTAPCEIGAELQSRLKAFQVTLYARADRAGPEGISQSL